jgi:hypothetical protein
MRIQALKAGGRTRAKVDRRQSDLESRARDQGQEVEVSVGNVDGEKAVVSEGIHVEPKCFDGEQVNGDGIAIECVEDEEIEFLGAADFLLSFDFQSGIADDDINFRQALREE